ncbi:MAG TPA: glutamyl-tRNA reductase [Chloroflexota bacterium]|nr:glutamyl-tRNA reductase [Chloroflexota bacterium]
MSHPFELAAGETLATHASLSVVGVNHRTAPLSLRERLAITDAALPSALQLLRAVAREAFVLSTCNRTEVYMVSDDSDAADAMTEILAQYTGVGRGEIEAHRYVRSGEGCVRHLLRVASGLDSMVLGETQILGQVRDALESAATAGAIGPVLGKVVPLALEIGKRSRSETRIGAGAISPSSVAVDLAKRALGDLRSRAVLVVGAGDAAQATARSLVDAGVREILVVNRSLQRAEEVAAVVRGRAVPYDDLVEGLCAADIVISSTSASEHVIGVPDVRAAMNRRGDRSLLFVDIAVPRDIDPAVASIPRVILSNIDDLEAICSANLLNRQREVAAVEEIVDAGLNDYRQWASLQSLVPTIGALYRQAESIRQSEVARTIPRLQSLSPDDRELIDVMTAAIVRRILHSPVAALKERGQGPDAERLVRWVRELFALDDATGARPGP